MKPLNFEIVPFSRNFGDDDISMLGDDDDLLHVMMSSRVNADAMCNVSPAQRTLLQVVVVLRAVRAQAQVSARKLTVKYHSH
jgi:hypothetical protein